MCYCTVIAHHVWQWDEDYGGLFGCKATPILHFAKSLHMKPSITWSCQTRMDTAGLTLRMSTQSFALRDAVVAVPIDSHNAFAQNLPKSIIVHTSKQRARSCRSSSPKLYLLSLTSTITICHWSFQTIRFMCPEDTVNFGAVNKRWGTSWSTNVVSSSSPSLTHSVVIYSSDGVLHNGICSCALGIHPAD